MERGGQTILALLVAGWLLALANPAVAVVGPSMSGAMVASRGLMQLTLDAHSLARQVERVTKDLLRQVRWFVRGMLSALMDAAYFWRLWLRRAAFSFAVIIIAALADSGLVVAWRAEGLRTLITFSTLMLYVYG